MILTPEQLNQLRASGYLHLQSLVPKNLVTQARAAIEGDLKSSYDPAKRLEYEHQSFCPALRDDDRMTGLLQESPAREVVDALLPFDQLSGSNWAQISLRDSHNHFEPIPPQWHLDGVPSPYNGVPQGPLMTFTALVGIFLSDTPGPYAGNLTVWPDSFERLRRWFEDRGLASLSMGRPRIDPGTPHQLITAPGDVVICHYMLAHGASVNTSPVKRLAVYFRLNQPGTARDPWRHLVDPWRGWRM